MGLKKYLHSKNYESVKLKRISTNHFEIDAKVNGIQGKFILDTGSSNSCLGFDEIEKFGLATAHSEHKAAGAGPEELDTLISEGNTIKIGNFKLKDTDLVLIDLAHINKALEKHEAKAVNGIIGADILDRSKAVIDYHKKKLYLKK